MFHSTCEVRPRLYLVRFFSFIISHNLLRPRARMNNVRGVYIYRYIEPNDIYKTFIRRIGRSANARPSMYSKDNCFAYDSSSLEF